MPKKIAIDKTTEQAMKSLGKAICQCRGEQSLRKIAMPSRIPASQLLAIEKGTLAPTADVYFRLLNALQPSEKQRDKMDKLYMKIRKVPPPDICALIIENPDIIVALRTSSLAGTATIMENHKFKGEVNG